MRRIPIFAVHSKDTEDNESHRRINGRALYYINLGDNLYLSESQSDEGYIIVDEIVEKDKYVTTLGATIKGTISFILHDQHVSINEFLYGDLIEDYIPTITFEEAKQMAEESGRSDLLRININHYESILSDIILEGECCWFFFFHPDIVIPENAWHQRKSAYTISMEGEISRTYDFSDDPIMFKDYMQAMSAYFKRKGF
ncbi:hypothetical protein [Paenibacillus qinlingensis]|uniref:hypothetical protein n=1 Tax=Paenibacillus qinlingensis TaxID=1837343 RepID=UPI001565AA98|nr:hypothetical protein [Paenibacillus qinlingensis]NQX61059.1 hypothetical protein [Paenibacillus qinlingensis]